MDSTSTNPELVKNDLVSGMRRVSQPSARRRSPRYFQAQLCGARSRVGFCRLEPVHSDTECREVWSAISSPTSGSVVSDQFAFSIVVLVVAAVLIAGTFSSRLTAWLRIPAPALFLIVAAVVALFLPALGPCLLYTSPSPRDRTRSRMPSSA